MEDSKMIFPKIVLEYTLSNTFFYIKILEYFFKKNKKILIK